MKRSKGDLLEATEIWNLLQNTKKLGGEEPKGHERKGYRHGPSSVLAGALKMVGWGIVEPCIWRNRGGENMDIRKASPAMLEKFLCRDWKTKQWEEAEAHIFGGTGVNRSVVEKLIQVWGKAKVLKAGIKWLAGALPHTV